MRCILAFWFNLGSTQNYLLALAILSAHSLPGANTSVTGSVIDDSGHPVLGARVLISSAPSVKSPVTAPPVIAGALAATVTAGSNGTFHVDGLAPGRYIACAEITAPGYLDPCHWSAAAPNFSIGAGETISGMKIVMPKGAVLWVHINDPQRLLKPVTGAVDFDFEIHMVTNKGLHYHVPIQGSTPAARDHAITIPFATPVTLRVLSAHLAVNDQAGKPFAAAGTAIDVPMGTTSPTVGLTIIGKK